MDCGRRSGLPGAAAPHVYGSPWPYLCGGGELRIFGRDVDCRVCGVRKKGLLQFEGG